MCFTVYSLHFTEYPFTNTNNQKLLTNAILQLVALWQTADWKFGEQGVSNSI